MKDIKNIKYDFLNRFKSGETLAIILTNKCNLKCSYCACDLLSCGKVKIKTEQNLREWVKTINEFPVTIKEVLITGGEPTLHKDFEGLVHLLLNRSIMVTIWTNLVKPITLEKSPRLKIVATYHHSASKTKFISNLEKLKGYQKVVYSFSNIFDGKSKNLFLEDTKENFPDCYRKRFVFAPDGKLFLSVKEAIS